MSEGYPDYTRLSRSGGVLLCSATGNITNLQQLFRGYVGNFPYVALTASLGVTAQFASIDLIWYSDNTFTTSVGFRRVIRTSSQFSETQYVNLSDWLLVQVETSLGTPFNFVWFSVYGCQAPGTTYQLVSADVPMFTATQSIPATSTMSFVPQHVQPGNAEFFLQTVVANWFVNLLYYDWNAFGYTLYRQYNSATYGLNVNEVFPCLDTPTRIDVHNGDASNRTFVLAWVSS